MSLTLCLCLAYVFNRWRDPEDQVVTIQAEIHHGSARRLRPAVQDRRFEIVANVTEERDFEIVAEVTE